MYEDNTYMYRKENIPRKPIHICLYEFINSLSLGVRVVEVELARSKGSHDGVEDSELPSSQSSNHDAPGHEAVGAKLDHANLSSDVHQSGGDGSVSPGSLLVHHTEQGVGRVGDDGSGNCIILMGLY